MQVFIELQKQCFSLLQSHTSCGQDCPIAFYCKQAGCEECDCSRCLNHIQRNSSPKFTYSCERITYQYVLRFFNRFASEICHAFSRFRYDNVSDINVLSLGCGPGSEVYGIFKALELKKSNAILHYKGYDRSTVWGKVQRISQECLANQNHDINFYSIDLFSNYNSFDNEKAVLLLLNYLLSDSEKFLKTTQEKRQFIEKLMDFILQNNIRNILFNDNSYYGLFYKLNSGYQLLNLLMQELRKKGYVLAVWYKHFMDDNYLGLEEWECHKSNKL